MMITIRPCARVCGGRSGNLSSGKEDPAAPVHVLLLMRRGSPASALKLPNEFNSTVKAQQTDAVLNHNPPQQKGSLIKRSLMPLISIASTPDKIPRKQIDTFHWAHPSIASVVNATLKGLQLDQACLPHP
eukprot:1141694-Pelagomonas_calceolata.AAC.4